MRHRQIETNGITLHAVEAGPEDGPLVILLHGFPEFWYGWREQIKDLSRAGYRVLVPDQRGYNLSDKPKGAREYGLDALCADVIGLIQAMGRKKTFLVGHDWGGIVAWWTALEYPEWIERVSILNVPHPIIMNRHLSRSFPQLLKSWYIFFFQLPFLPEKSLSLMNYKVASRSLIETSRPGTFSSDDLKEYQRAWSQPGALKSMIHWYRAMIRNKPSTPPSYRVSVPTLLIWGVRDKFLGREMAQPSVDLCDKGRLVLLQDASHWVQHEEPQRVNELLREFFSKDCLVT